MKRNLPLVILFICALLIGAFIWFVDRDDQTSVQQQQQARTVFSIYPDSIVSILMERGGVQIECSKTSGNWRLTRPTDAPVDSGIVQKMIANMARVEHGELIVDKTLKERGLTPSDYGFDEPRARLTFQNNHGTFTWLIGRNAPLGDMLYIMEEGGGDIIAVPQTLLNLIPEDPSWIRDRTLFRDKAASVRGIDLRRPAGFLQLRQPENNGWLLQQPHQGRADILSVHTLIENIFSASIVKFVTDEKTDLTDYGLEEPAYELTLFTLDEKTQTLRIGKINPEQPETRYAKWVENDSVFTVSNEWIKLFDIDGDQLRSRHLLGVLPARISDLQLTHNEQQIGFVQTNETWKITRPARWDSELGRVKELLQTLAQAVILDFKDTPSPEQIQQLNNAPWVLSFSADAETHTLRITEVNANGLRLVQRDQESSFYDTPADIINEAFADPLFFRNRTVLEVDPARIAKITQQTEGKEYVIQAIDNTFSSAEQTQRLDSDALFNMTTLLSALRTTQYIAFNPESLATYGLDTPSFRINISLNGTDTLGRVILLGTPVDGGGRFAMLQGQAIVFVLSDETVQVLTRELTLPLEPNKKAAKAPELTAPAN